MDVGVRALLVLCAWLLEARPQKKKGEGRKNLLWCSFRTILFWDLSSGLQAKAEIGISWHFATGQAGLVLQRHRFCSAPGGHSPGPRGGRGTADFNSSLCGAHNGHELCCCMGPLGLGKVGKEVLQGLQMSFFCWFLLNGGIMLERNVILLVGWCKERKVQSRWWFSFLTELAANNEYTIIIE